MRLDPKCEYGFTEVGASCTERLPVWDRFRLERIMDIYSTCETILDIGESSRGLPALLAKQLAGHKWLVVDKNASCHPDVVADVCNLDMFKDGSVDGIVCGAILEHVCNPFAAVSELSRVLRPGGKMFVYVPWVWRHHAPANREFLDYYRYSADAVRHLFRNFSRVEICPVRGFMESMLNFIPFLGKGSMFHRLFGGLIRRVDFYDERFASGFNVYLVK